MTHRTYGYARVSRKQQNESRQVQNLITHGVDERFIMVDKESGKDLDRPQYELLRNALRNGDILVIPSIDRLGRNYNQIIQEWGYLTKELVIDIQVLDMPLLDTTVNKDLLGSFISDLVLQILSYVAEQERTFIKKRQTEGIALAKQNSKRLGRPKIPQPKNFEEVHITWKNGSISSKHAQELLGLRNL
ncbi:recombinase family protein [Erysipelothrix urinaevulpis]|uniref:recombinase family protein n=1 Tax=Erysipelothrix urinaevulpis TaxID=2683717 RepID=UPI001F3DBDE8|nr:recombinase family protein [Erysipelothrix urinaevulpis]